jgi:hypothetical protein
VRIANGDPDTMTWAVKDGAQNPATLVTLSAASPGTWANAVDVSLSTDKKTLTVTLDRIKESYAADKAGALADAINGGSRLLRSSAPGDADKDKAADSIAASQTKGSDKADVSSSDAKTGLDVLANERNINIVVVGGMDAKTAGGSVLSHLESTENDGRERIAVLGASSDDPAKIASDDLSKLGNARAVLVAPGIVADDAARPGPNRAVKLPASYAAALVAGKLASLAPHISLTNKDVPADDLTTDYTRADQKQLLLNRVMVLQENLGIRCLKGITTDDGAFRQISVRRIVDYAKAGVRAGSNPYIGRLNNARVRAALKATLDGFLAGMVFDEMLIG